MIYFFLVVPSLFSGDGNTSFREPFLFNSYDSGRTIVTICSFYPSEGVGTPIWLTNSHHPFGHGNRLRDGLVTQAGPIRVLSRTFLLELVNEAPFVVG